MNKEQAKSLLDKFAGQAMQALIAKAPFFDREGEFGRQLSQEQLAEIKKGISETAYEYAEYMLIARGETKDWVDKNFPE